MSRTRPRVLAISSRGGHWTQLRRLRKAFDGCDVTWVCTDATMRAEVTDGQFEIVHDANRWQKFRLVLCAFRVALLLLRLRPDVVISTGAAPGYFALRIGKMFGARTLWLDSIANAEELSLSGRKASEFADLTLTQWPELGQRLPERDKRVPRTIYHAGAVV
jgi:UDP-N-acetylglucosamine:LPS N-acetylglucosamine transferase